jgi:hypothetical protein
MCRTPVINEFPASEDVFFGYGNQQLRDLPEQSEETRTYAKSKAFQYLLWFLIIEVWQYTDATNRKRNICIKSRSGMRSARSS